MVRSSIYVLLIASATVATASAESLVILDQRQERYRGDDGLWWVAVEVDFNISPILDEIGPSGEPVHAFGFFRSAVGSFTWPPEAILANHTGLIWSHEVPTLG